ncbi:MAG: DNA helicase UvrD, partial [Candidatus Aenigmarchaeota archaeon]|nr:DNA helicase UvrD [Candidatus Aenigmarchaeota archaeon]
YHYDGHRNCNFSCQPEESKKLDNKCPKCGSALTIGVLNRVEQLADRPLGEKPQSAKPFKSLVPLSELIGHAFGTTPFSKKTWEIYNLFVEKFGNEFNVMLNADSEELKKVNEKAAEIILKNRKGKIKITPGYDGVYGKMLLENHSEENKLLLEKKDKNNEAKTGLKRFL